MTYPLTLLFIFMVFWRPQEWLFPWLYGWPLLQVVVYGALISLMAEANQKSMPMPKTPAIMLAVGLWFASIMSHAANGYFQGMLNTIPDTFKLSFFLVLLMVVMNSVDRLRGVVLMFLVAAVIMSIHALMQQSLGYGFGGGEPLRTYRKTGEVIYQSQFYGIFSDPNDMGQFLAASLPLAFAFPRRLIPVSFMLVAGIGWLIVEAMFSTYSRGTLIGVIAMGACLVFLRFPTRWMPYMAVLGLMGGLVVCATQGSVLLDQSARERVVFWGDANRVFKQYPLFGIGYGMFEDVVTEKSRASHNAYVSCYTELGFFGYWFWFNLITLGAIGCYRTRVAFRRPRNSEQAYLKRLAGLSIASLAGFAASAYFLSRAYVFPLFFLVGLLNAIPMIAQRYLPEEHPPLLNWRKDVLLTGTIASAISIIYIYSSIILLNRGF